MSNIYMGYLTESEREELILEKEVELLLIDNDYLHESGKINIPKLQKLNDTIHKFFSFKKKKKDVVVLPNFYEGTYELLKISIDLYKHIKDLVNRLESISKLSIDKYTDNDCDAFEKYELKIVNKYFKPFNKNSVINPNKIVKCNNPHFMADLEKLINDMGDISKKFISSAKEIIRKSEQIDDEENPWMITRNFICSNIDHMIKIIYDNINTMNKSIS